MTISYSGGFWKLLIRYKGSIWKATWKELLAFLVMYYCVNLVYRFWLIHTPAKELFENLVVLFDSYLQHLALTFLLGFYINAVVKRWWDQFQDIAWPEDVLTYVCHIVNGVEESAVRKRRVLARWLNLTAVLAWRDVSVSVRKRFPTLDEVVESKLLTKEELQVYEKMTSQPLLWALPLHWVQRIVEDEIARRGVPTAIANQFLAALNSYRGCFRRLFCYDWVCIPLVYTQVAALATYGYFLLCLIGRQCIDPTRKLEHFEVDIYVPFFTIIEFMFYVGWLKVGQYLMRPFEEDDDDLELNYILDRNVQASFAFVDEAYQCMPPNLEDPFCGLSVYSLPHTCLSIKQGQHPPKLHAGVMAHDRIQSKPLIPGIDYQQLGVKKIRMF